MEIDPFEGNPCHKWTNGPFQGKNALFPGKLSHSNAKYPIRGQNIPIAGKISQKCGKVPIIWRKALNSECEHKLSNWEINVLLHVSYLGLT